MLGMLYMNGKGVDLDFDEARRLFEEAARQGEAKAYFNLGWLNFLENDDEASAASFQQAAELGHLPAYYMLAFHYLHGRGIEQSVVKYAETLQAAIDKGSAEAQLEWHTFLKSVRQNAAAGDEEATQNLHVLEESGLI